MISNSITERTKLSDAAMRVVIPTRNFGNGLRRFLDAWRTQLEKLGRSAEFVVIDDCSTDDTCQTAIDYAQRFDTIRVIRHDAPCGLGASLRDALADLDQPIALVVVPDWPYRPSDVREFLRLVDESDVVVGVRPGLPRSKFSERLGRWNSIAKRVVFGFEATPPAPWYGWPDWRSRVCRRLVYGIRLQDPGCGLLMIRKEFLQRCPIQSDGAFAIVELAAKVNFASGVIAEVPVGRSSDMPTMSIPFENMRGDERIVLRRPKFAASIACVDTSEKTLPVVEPSEQTQTGGEIAPGS